VRRIHEREPNGRFDEPPGRRHMWMHMHVRAPFTGMPTHM